MSLVLTNGPSIFKRKSSLFSSKRVAPLVGNFRVKAFFNPIGEKLLKEAFQEPVAFMGGMFAGLLRLDLNEDPLKEWLTTTVEASGIVEEEIAGEESVAEDDDTPLQIEIE